MYCGLVARLKLFDRERERMGLLGYELETSMNGWKLSLGGGPLSRARVTHS
jgi:hypothetical protein